MENKTKLMLYGLFAFALLVTGTYTMIINYASAVPSVATLSYGFTCVDDADTFDVGVVAKTNNLNTNKAWFVCENSVTGVLNVVVTHATTDTVIATIPLGSGHTDSAAIAYVEDFSVVVVSTNLGYAVIDEPTNSLLRNVTSTQFDDFFSLYYHRGQNVIYGLQSNGFMRMTYDDSDYSLDEIATHVLSDCTASCLGWDFDESSGNIFLVNNGGSADDSAMRISDTTWTVQAEVTVNAGSPWDIAVDTESQKVYVAWSALAAVRKYDFSMTQEAAITVTSTPRSIEFDSPNDFLYVVADSDDTMRIYDGTSNAQVGASLAICASPVMPINLKSNTDETLVFVPCTGTSARIIHSDLIIEGSLGEPACIDVNFDGQADVCYEDVNGDGIPDASPLELARASQNVTESANTIACQIGIETACDNPDPKTNGVGYLLVIILLAFMIVMFALARLKTSLIIPEWLWIIGTFGVLGASIYLGWIDTTLFIIGTVVVVALASFKVVAQFTSGDF